MSASSETAKPAAAAAVAMSTHVSAIINHHMKQHIDAATGAASSAAGAAFFYLGVIEATAQADGTVTSNGKGMFTGPLKTRTAAERDMVAAQFSAIPNLRQRLDNPDAELVLIAQVAVNGTTHCSITGIGVRDAVPTAASK